MSRIVAFAALAAAVLLGPAAGAGTAQAEGAAIVTGAPAHVWHRHHVRRDVVLPGVLGMDIGAPVYWRPGVPVPPDVIYETVEVERGVPQRGAVVRARY